jgi:Tfp pilus assembly protein PilE
MRGRWSASVAIVLLLSVLGIAGALAYQAQYAARSHRTTAENVLRDYAAFAAWEFSRTAGRELTNTVESVLGHVMVSCRGDEPPDLARLKAQGG